ncbi:MAG: DUF4340 domain-containing protein [Pseudomonadota bacterium]
MSGGRKALGGLAVAAAASVGLAIVAANSSGPKPAAFEPAPAFPDAQATFEAARALRLRAADFELHIDFDADKGWSVRERDGYPADLAAVRAALIGLEELELRAPRTKNETWHSALGLTDPDADGEAVSIALLGEAGEGAPLAELLVGDVAQGGGGGTLDRLLYVRRPGDAQTWLAAGRLDPSTRIADWLALDGLQVTRDDVVKISISPADGPAYSAARTETPEGETEEAAAQTGFSAAFSLTPPEGRALRSETAADTVAFAITRLNLLDARKASAELGEPIAKAAYVLKEGADLFAELYEADEKRWVVFSAGGGPQGEDLAARLAGWAFEVSEYQFDRLAPPLEDLLAPLEEEDEATEGDAGSDSAGDAEADALGAPEARQPDDAQPTLEGGAENPEATSEGEAEPPANAPSSSDAAEEE